MTDERYQQLMRDVGMPNSRSLLQALQQVANEVGQQCASDKRVLDDLAQLVARLARTLRKAAPDNELADKAMDYLKRKGLQGSPLRQNHAYALGLARGLKSTDLTNEEILELADPFGCFQYGDAQGDKRLDFARAILAAARNK